MRDLPPTLRNRSSGRLPSTYLSIYKKPSPEESRSSRMSMSWIPGFILVLIHHGIFGIYKNILGEGSKANCLLAWSCMSGNVHVRFREKGGGKQKLTLLYLTLVFNGPASRRFCAINPSGRRLVVGGPAELSEKGSLGGADTPARITGDGYKNGGEVNSTRRHSGMDVDPSGRDNHSGPRRGGDHSQEPKRLS
ncbi:hypothetical protein KPL71_026394 [Citrus sinensis]|uniref:Uncharacterized protein n=1 Tax=Citrus sinensis TaxID=2711 RepID=A0ACB8HZ12_CITSI|nr:hypothetical protein KPL71_026394 [Citrus sinensis]